MSQNQEIKFLLAEYCLPVQLGFVWLRFVVKIVLFILPFTIVYSSIFLFHVCTILSMYAIIIHCIFLQCVRKVGLYLEDNLLLGGIFCCNIAHGKLKYRNKYLLGTYPKNEPLLFHLFWCSILVRLTSKPIKVAAPTRVSTPLLKLHCYSQEFEWKTLMPF